MQKIFAIFVVLFTLAPVFALEKIHAVYTSIGPFASRAARQAAIDAQPSFLMEKHKASLGGDNASSLKVAHDAGFNTLFMTIYPLWGKEWWNIPAARNLVKDSLVQTKGKFHTHLGLSIFNANFCAQPERYPGASRTIQCDGTRPSWVCFFDDALWDVFIRNAVEMAKVGKEAGNLDGIFIDPEGYGGEEYLCFCDNCVRKFNAWRERNPGDAGDPRQSRGLLEKMPTGLVKPDSWLLARGLWKKYTVDWHDYEVRRHAAAMRQAIHAVDPHLRLSSLLWDYPVAVGIHDAREGYFRNLAIGLGTKEQPSWTLPEHTYYSDAADLARIIQQMQSDLHEAGAADRVQILPGIRPLRQSAQSLIARGKVIDDSAAVGYWMYELSDLMGKTPIDFEGELLEPEANYVSALKEMNRGKN